MGPLLSSPLFSSQLPAQLYTFQPYEQGTWDTDGGNGNLWEQPAKSWPLRSSTKVIIFSFILVLIFSHFFGHRSSLIRNGIFIFIFI